MYCIIIVYFIDRHHYEQKNIFSIIYDTPENFVLQNVLDLRLFQLN